MEKEYLRLVQKKCPSEGIKFNLYYPAIPALDRAPILLNATPSLITIKRRMFYYVAFGGVLTHARQPDTTLEP